MATLKIKVRCVSCKAQKDIDEAEAQRLSEINSIPMCGKCGMPMVAISATARLNQ